jgi:hypothetical protein
LEARKRRGNPKVMPSLPSDRKAALLETLLRTRWYVERNRDLDMKRAWLIVEERQRVLSERREAADFRIKKLLQLLPRNFVLEDWRATSQTTIASERV